MVTDYLNLNFAHISIFMTPCWPGMLDVPLIRREPLSRGPFLPQTCGRLPPVHIPTSPGNDML